MSYIYKTKLELLIDEDEITHEEAIQALDEACAELKNPRSREKFYELLTSKLGQTIGE